MSDSAREHVDSIAGPGGRDIAAHLRAEHGKTYDAEWKSRIQLGYGYEFKNWHAELFSGV